MDEALNAWRERALAAEAHATALEHTLGELIEAWTHMSSSGRPTHELPSAHGQVEAPGT